jgi:hypothetical protein
LAVSTQLPPPLPPSCLDASPRWISRRFRCPAITSTSLAFKREPEVEFFDVSTLWPPPPPPFCTNTSRRWICCCLDIFYGISFRAPFVRPAERWRNTNHLPLLAHTLLRAHSHPGRGRKIHTASLVLAMSFIAPRMRVRAPTAGLVLLFCEM